MNLAATLTKMIWKPLFRSSRSRLRRRQPYYSGYSAAEVLEQRALLAAANVNLTVAAGAITLASTDSNNAQVNVTRDGGNVEFFSTNGTQITYQGVAHTTAFEVAIPTVSSVTVNLGKGYDQFYIYDLSTTGNVTFNGNPGGGAGADVEVYAENRSVVIGGSVIANVGNESGPNDSYVEVYTDGPTMTVNGSITVNESGTGYKEVDVFTAGGNLTVKGSIFVTSSGSGESDVFIYSQGSTDDVWINTGYGGSLTVNGSVTIIDSGSGNHYNEIYSQSGGGAVLVQGGVTVLDFGTGYSEFDIQSLDGGSNVTIYGSVFYSNAGNTSHDDNVYITGDTSNEGGTVAIRGSLTLLLASDSSSGNYVELGGDFDESSKQLTVGGPVLITSGCGADEIDVNEAVFRSGVIINTGSNPSSTEGGDLIDVVGTEFDGAVLVSMSGPNAQIDINHTSGFEPTVFKSFVTVFMTGPNASIYLSNSEDSGTPVQFDALVLIVGGFFGRGRLHVDGPVSYAFKPLLINFS